MGVNEDISQIYIGYFNRAPEEAGYNYWIGRNNAGMSLDDIAQSFSEQVESIGNYPYLADKNANSPENFIKSIYNNLFNREPDAAGLSYWMDELNNGFPIGKMILAIINGAQDNSDGQDRTTMLNKVDVSVSFAQSSNGGKLPNDEAIAKSKTVLLNVTETSQSVTDAKATFLGAKGEEFDFNHDANAKDVINKIVDDNADGTFGTASSGGFSISTDDSGSVISLDDFWATPEYRDIKGQGYSVVILDTGIDLNHRFFGADADNNGISDRIIYSQDFTGEGDGTADDVNGHGTNVASIAASSDSQYPGIVPEANIIALQVLSNSGRGGWSALEEALRWVVNNADRYNIAAINMSLGDGQNYSSLVNANGVLDELQALQSLGVISVAAAGNDYFQFQQSGVAFPAIVPGVVGVGATFDAAGGQMSWQSGARAFSREVDQITPFSQRGTNLTDIFAPGAVIEGAAVGGGVAGQTGTSQAAPHIAGIAVLAQQLAERELGRRLTTDEFVDLMQSSGTTIFDGDNENDNVSNTNTNYKRVDVKALADAIVARAGNNNGGGNQDIAQTINTSAEMSVGSTLSSDIGSNGDADWVKIWLNAGSSYTIDLQGSPSGKGTLSDSWLNIYDSAGIFVTSNDDGGVGTDSKLVFTPNASGYYFLSAESYGQTGTGTYQLSVSGSGLSDDYSGDTGTSGRISSNGSVQGTVNFNGDRDWFAITLQAGQDYTFRLDGGSLSDPLFEIYDQNGISPLATDDDGGAGLNAQLQFTASYSGTYYLSAKASGTGTGSYTLTASQQTVASVSDIVLRNTSTGEIGVWDFTGNGGFTFHTIQDNLGLNWTPQVTANLVTRGNDDMVLRDSSSGAIGYWDFTDNGGRTWNLIQDNLSTQWQVKGAGDFTLDGRDDIILRNVSTGEIGIWDFEPNGAINWTSIQDNLSTTWKVQGAGDLTNDGHDDIILRNDTSGAIGYWKFGANGAREWIVIQDNLGLSWQVKGVLDITNDGHDDIILRNESSGAIGYWDFYNGANNWAWVPIQDNLSLDWRVHGTGDFTGDLHEDIVLRNEQTGAIGYWDFNENGGRDYVEVQSNLSLTWQVQGTADIWGV